MGGPVGPATVTVETIFLCPVFADVLPRKVPVGECTEGFVVFPVVPGMLTPTC